MAVTVLIKSSSCVEGGAKMLSFNQLTLVTGTPEEMYFKLLVAKSY